MSIGQSELYKGKKGFYVHTTVKWSPKKEKGCICPSLKHEIKVGALSSRLSARLLFQVYGTPRS